MKKEYMFIWNAGVCLMDSILNVEGKWEEDW